METSESLNVDTDELLAQLLGFAQGKPNGPLLQAMLHMIVYISDDDLEYLERVIDVLSESLDASKEGKPKELARVWDDEPGKPILTVVE